MNKNADGGVGHFALVLHAHLPYVLHHGTWPHGLEWLLEAAAETYLPLLQAIGRLRQDGISLCANVSLSPVLLEQLVHPDFQAELPKYLQRKINSAEEDAAFFEQANELHLLSLAQQWKSVFRTSLDFFHSLDGDIVRAFRDAEANGSIRLLTSAATHGYAPLMGTDGAIRAQFLTGLATHRQHLGKAPAGVWLPECGYRPSGLWHFPVCPVGMDAIPAPRQRAGIEDALQQAGYSFTFVDTHLVENAQPPCESTASRSIYRPYTIASSSVAVFARDPRTALQVWSPQYGYPGDFAYLDFHKKRWPGGHRYWRVTAADLGMEAKQPYYPDAAAERTRVHAEHFVQLIAETLHVDCADHDAPAILCAPFDLELFGHWWHEGVAFLEHVARVLHTGRHGISPAFCEDYLAARGTSGRIHMPEGSWGANGDNSVWLNPETAALQSEVYAAELVVEKAATEPAWTDGGTGRRLAAQLCRELLLMQASDWPTLITTGAARDYAEQRFRQHNETFQALHGMWLRHLQGTTLTAEEESVLVEAERSDDLFPALQTADWR